MGANVFNYFWVAVGGALGSVMRFWLSGVVANQLSGSLARMTGNRLSEVFPWGTMAVNIGGSFLIGFIATATAPEGRLLLSPALRQQFLMLGMLGGFTTFSSFSLQTLNLIRDGEWFMATANVILSVTICMVAVWLGHVLASSLNR
jgi:CrcB protein